MARTYFTHENTDGVDKADLAVMNRAGRMVADVTHCNPPQFKYLSHIRTAYRPGMSAFELYETVTK